MGKVTFKGDAVETAGSLPEVGTQAPDFTLTKQDLSDVHLSNYGDKKKVLNIFPSLDTSVCASTVKNFYKKLSSKDDVVVLNISQDLPFAHNRFCCANGIDNAETLSAFRSSFGREWGVAIEGGPLKGLCSRAVVILDANNRILYAEQVPEITQEPDYDRVLQILNTR